MKTSIMSWEEVGRLWEWHKLHKKVPIILDDDGEHCEIEKGQEEDAKAFINRQFPYDDCG